MPQQHDILSNDSTNTRSVIVDADLSHGTLESINLSRARPLYEKTFGLRVVRHAKIGQLIAGRGEFVAVSIAAGSKFAEQSSDYRWLVILPDGENLQDRFSLAQHAQADGHLKQLKPITVSRGAESFLAQDLDGNWWEVSNLPPRYFQDQFVNGSAASQ